MNYMIIGKSYRDMIPTKAIYFMDFLAIVDNDGSYEVLKNRFTEDQIFKDHASFMSFAEKHLMK